MLKIKFIKRLLVFFFIFLITLNSVCFLLIQFNWHAQFIENGQVYYAISKSRKTNPDMDIVLIGGSVANQMFNSRVYNDSINSFCSVMPITMTGQYLILKNIVKHNKLEGKQVIMIMHPNGFTAKLNGAPLYHYFLKPFYNNEFMPLMDSDLKHRLSKIPFKWLYRIPMVRCTNWTPIKGSINLEDAGAKLSLVSVNYLHKIEKLAKQHGFSFKLLPPVQPKKNKELDYSGLKEEIHDNDLDSIFCDYFQRMQYLNDDLFQDGFHAKYEETLNACAIELLSSAHKTNKTE